MSTVFEVSAAVGAGQDSESAQAALVAALDEVARIEQLMSTYLGSSELSQVNAAAGGEPLVVSAELYALVERSLAVCVETGGLMDPTFGPLGRAWNFRREPFVPPTEQELLAARDLVGCRAVELDGAAGTLRLPREGMSLGLGAVAKGYAVDRASALLLEAGLGDHLVNGGGDVVARGSKAQGPWVVGVQHPRARGDLLGRVPLRDRALVTSGDYERFAEVDGVRYHHVIDPRTGWPTQGLVSVSVMAGSAERADGLATALMVAGPEEAASLLGALPEVDALLVEEGGDYQATPGFSEVVGLAVVP